MSVHPYRACTRAIADVQAGMRLASPVYDFNGKMLLSQGTLLTEKHLALLQHMLILQATVWAKDLPAPPPPIGPAAATVLPAPPAAAAQPAWDPFWLQEPQQEVGLHYRRLLQEGKRLYSLGRLQGEILLDILYPLTEDILALTLSPVDTLRCLHLHPRHEPYIFHHSLHVSLLSALVARACSFPEERLRALAVSALLHDVGKLRVPLELLNKAQPLSPGEQESVQLHALLGFRFLQRQKKFDLPILMGVLQHHERLDGSGYPLHTCRDKTHVFAKIIALADVYDAMTSQKKYGLQHSPFEALGEIQDGLQTGRLDPSYGQVFLALLQAHSCGEWLELSDGRRVRLLAWAQKDVRALLVQTAGGERLELSAGGVRPLRFVPPPDCACPAGAREEPPWTSS